MTNSAVKTVTLPAYCLGLVEDKFNAIIKTAEKLGLEVPSFKVTKEFMVKRVRSDYTEERVPYVEIEITGEYPAYNGWKFVAQLDHSEKLVKSISEKNYNALIGDCSCDHCNSNRSRKVTYVIEKDGIEKRVGGACLKFYITNKSLTSVAAMCEFYNSFESLDDEFQRGCHRPAYTLSSVVALSLFMTEYYGMYKSRDYGFDSTRSQVEVMINPMGSEQHKIAKAYFDIYDNEKFMAKQAEVVKWVKSITPKTDFEFNLQSIANNGYVSDKSFGLAVAFAVAWQNNLKFQEKNKAKEATQKEEAKSEYVGTIKKREVFELELKHLVLLDSDYGTTFMHKFVDQNGNVFVWYGSKGFYDEDGELIREGKMTVKATVKDHKEYKGIKQTMITRVNRV